MWKPKRKLLALGLLAGIALASAIGIASIIPSSGNPLVTEENARMLNEEIRRRRPHVDHEKEKELEIGRALLDGIQPRLIPHAERRAEWRMTVQEVEAVLGPASFVKMSSKMSLRTLGPIERRYYVGKRVTYSTRGSIVVSFAEGRLESEPQFYLECDPPLPKVIIDWVGKKLGF